jgi:hypothetical protein
MKIARLVGLMVVAVMALGLVVASAAFAEPAFLPVGATFTGTSGTGVLEAGGEKIECTADTSAGTISSATLVGGVTVSFTGCKAIKGTEKCTVKSPSAAAGSIVTHELHGVLGLVLPKGTGTGVGLLLLPVENKKFVTIESTKCSIETTVSGNLVGEVTPVGVHTTKGTLVFKKGATEGQSIKSFDLSTGGSVTPKLEAFGKEAGEETTEVISWSAAVEVS